MPVVVGIIIASIAIANSWHVIASYAGTPLGYVHTGIAHYFADYFLYVSQIVQGSHTTGLIAQHLYTNEKIAGTWIYWSYLLLGKLPGNPYVLYNTALCIAAVCLLVFWWMIIKKTLQGTTERVVAFLFVATASNWPTISTWATFGRLSLGNDFWFSPTPALNRLGGVPHQILQTIFLLAVIYIWNILKESWHPRLLAPLAVAAILATTANPIQMLLLVSTCMVFVIAEGINHKRFTQHEIIRSLALCAPALIAAIVTNREFAGNPILTAAKVWEDSQQVRVSLWQLFLAMGPLGPLSLVGLHSLFAKKHSRLYRLLTTYSLVSIAVFLSPVPGLLGTSPVRWLSPAAYAGLAILGSEGLFTMLRLGKSIRIPTTLSLTVGIMLYALFTIPSLVAQVQARTLPLTNDPVLLTLNHISPEVISGMRHIDPKQKTGVVLTDPAIPYDVIVPIYSGLPSFTGHPIHTLYPGTKELLRQQFFTRRMSDADAKQFLTNHNIAWILTTPERLSTISSYPFLTKTFANATLVILTASL